MIAVLLAILSLAVEPPAAAPDYAGFSEKGVPFARFLADADSLKSEWDANFAGATIEDASLARAKALKSSWRILVVAEDSCHRLARHSAVSREAGRRIDPRRSRCVSSPKPWGCR